MARQVILRAEEDGKQLLPVTGFEQVKRGGAGKTLEDSMLEVEKLVPIMAAYGCNYNAETGFFEYAGLTDLTADDCRNMLVETGMYTIEDIAAKYAYCKSRVNLIPISAASNKRGYFFAFTGIKFNGAYAFYYAREIELIQLCSDYNGISFGFALNEASNMFANCHNLKRITGNIYLDYSPNVTNMFLSCNLLESVRILHLKTDISFSDSPLLSYESVKYLVDNAANTDPITVTVHGDVYAKLSGTASEYGDHTQEEWTAIMTAATDKQISFATV